MTPTFESEFLALWATFVAFSIDMNNSTNAVIAAEKQFDADVEDLRVKYSHPPGVPPNRRR